MSKHKSSWQLLYLLVNLFLFALEAVFADNAMILARHHFDGKIVELKRNDILSSITFGDLAHSNHNEPSAISIMRGSDNITFKRSIDFGSTISPFFVQNAYIIDKGSNTVFICPLGLSGAINTCYGDYNPGSDLGGLSLTGPGNMVFYTPNLSVLDQRFAYITNFSGAEANTIAICPVNFDGSIGSRCTVEDGGSTFTSPNGLTIANDLLYVANGGTTAPSVTICEIQSCGLLGDCTNTSLAGVTPWGTNGIAINPSNTLAYITNFYSSYSSATGTPGLVSVCPVNNDGSLNTSCCFQADGDGSLNPILNGPIDVKINSTNTFAYISNSSDTNIVVCSIDSSDGTFYSCNTDNGGGNIDNPAGIFLSSSNYIYIANNANNDVVICQLTGGGSTLTGCTTFTNSGGTSFTTANDVFIF